VYLSSQRLDSLISAYPVTLRHTHFPQGTIMSARQTPPFRADHVGSLLRPATLKEARRRHAEGAIDAAGLAAVEDREIERVVAKQQALGLQGITDGAPL
jgi:hypothetical protein